MLIKQTRDQSKAKKLTREPILPDLLTELHTVPCGVPAQLWEEGLASPLDEFLSRSGKRFRSRLVELSWQYSASRAIMPEKLPYLVELLHAGSLIIDDIEDDSFQRRGRTALHRQTGLPIALNAGNWLYFWPLELLSEMEFRCATERRLQRRMIRAIKTCHEGQALDLVARVGRVSPHQIPELVLNISRWKTGSLMGLAAAMGAEAAEAEPSLVEALEVFGVRLGVGLQMQNDLTELTGAAGPIKHPEDLINGRVTWPWAWAASRMSEAQFLALQARGEKLSHGEGDAAKLADELLDALGDDPVRYIRYELQQAISDLRHALPDTVDLSELEEELARLETRYA